MGKYTVNSWKTTISIRYFFFQYFFDPVYPDRNKYFPRQKGEHTLRAGFEPARGDPIGFRVQRLNHSAITADAINSR